MDTFFIKYMKTCIWAAMHDKYFSCRQFFYPGKIKTKEYWEGEYSPDLAIFVHFPGIYDPFPEYIYWNSGVWTEGEIQKILFDQIPF